MVKGTNFLDWALRYARLGWRVFPCAPREKRPLIHDWPHKASSDPTQIREWWSRWPDANIAVVCGNGLAVLDFDPRNGGDWTDYDLPETITCHTGGGGRHYYFAATPGVRGTKVAPGVDLKGEGGYVIAPPSIHPNGEAYIWEAGAAPWEAQLATLPGWVLGGEAPNVPTWRVYKDRPIPEGQRNNVLFSYACYLRRNGADEGVILKALKEWNGRCAPPLEERELVGIARSAARYAPVVASDRHKGGKASQTKRERARELLEAGRWVRYRNRDYLVYHGELFTADEAYDYLALQGLLVSKNTATELAQVAAGRAEREGRIGSLDGKVVLTDPAPRYGRAGELEGIFYRYGGKVWCYTAQGRLVEVRDGEVYYRLRASLPVRPEGGLQDLLTYIFYTFSNLASPSDPLVALAAVAPVLLGLGNAGLLLEGPGGSGKSTAGRALYRLLYQNDAPTAIGDTKRDLVATVVDRRVVFHDDIEAMDRVMEDLIRIGITGGTAEVRELYTTSPTQLDLSGSAILCGVSVVFRNPTTIERFVRLSFTPRVRGSEYQMDRLFEECAPRAMGGLFELFARAAQEAPPDPGELGEIRLRDWYGWAIRFAKALRVEEDFRRWLVDMSGGLFERLGVWGELYHLLRSGEVKEGKHPLSKLAEKVLERRGGGDNKAKLTATRAAVRNGGQLLMTITERAGFSLVMGKERDPENRKYHWVVTLTRKAYSPPNDAVIQNRAAEALARLNGIQTPGVDASVLSVATAPDPTMDTAPPPSLATESAPTAELPPTTEPAPFVATDIAPDWGPFRRVEYIVRERFSAQTQAWANVVREVTRGISPKSPNGALWTKIIETLNNALQLLLRGIIERTQLELLPDGEEKTKRLDELEALNVQTRNIAEQMFELITSSQHLLHRVYQMALIENAPGDQWFAVGDIIDKVRGAGFDELAREYDSMIQPFDAYKARLGIACLARGVWEGRRTNPEGFQKVWPRLAVCLEMALGKDWEKLLDLPKQTAL